MEKACIAMMQRQQLWQLYWGFTESVDEMEKKNYIG